ncbi:hypothetical protein GGD67_002864 [Bradyrhizobium sp. IAR9]|uniref:glycosyl hydrolase 115 family protein n=1 Tax=Bradyrhizobium sp. IAR9 TaxID=2663841 RepID=UPI0015C95AD6|nr:glycosyl hydrolase 115 family protein [Bradyrhizobium sp. IAR9]NYG45406.1 hypothetical protein [Bradyrhizobium sp. IAR9]
MPETEAAAKNDAQWGRRDVLRLSAQAASILSLSQAVAMSLSNSADAADAHKVSEAGGAKHEIFLTADTPWIISGKEPEPLQRALADVARDWYKVFGHRPPILAALPEDWGGPAIYFGLQSPDSKPRISMLPGRESFSLGVQRIDGGPQAVMAVGADLRGAIYAAYAFSEQVLEVDPWWYWADKEPSPRTSIPVREDLLQQFGSPTFKHRGLWLDSEDILNGFSPDPLGENPLSLEMLDRICETLLRLRGNLLVPGCYAFADERCYELISRRGLMSNTTHLVPVGLNVLRWPADVPYSYSRHPEIMERYWRECIAALKDKEVVWTVGYRGRYDYPFWVDDPGLETPEARGALITRAIAKQVELIRQVQPNAPIISHMWSEATKLYLDGFIQLPAGVTLVWPDNGAGFMRDAGKVRPGNGIYYHTMVAGPLGNRLTEFVPPERIYHELGRFIRAGATEFFLINAGNLRSVPLSTECAMKMVWDARPYLSQPDQTNHHNFLLEWVRRQFGPELAPRAANLYRDYFAIPGFQAKLNLSEAVNLTSTTDIGHLKEYGAAPAGDQAPFRYLYKLCEQVLPLMESGRSPSPATVEQAEKHRQLAVTNLGYLPSLLAKAEGLASKIPEQRRDFYVSHMLTALRIHVHANEMLDYYCGALERLAVSDHADAIQHLERALVSIDALFTSLRLEERNKWAGWYSGETFLGLEYGRSLLRACLAALRGEPPSPLHILPGYKQLHEYNYPKIYYSAYSRVYQYQDRFKHNFPLLYGTPRSPPH